MDAMGTPCYRGPAGRPYDARVRRLIALVCVLIVFDLALWSAVVPLLPHYRHALGLSTLQTAWILAAFSLAVIVVAVPMGHLADRIGPRLVTAIGTLSMAVATAGLALASSFGELMVARVFQGAADAAVWGAGLAWVAARAPIERRGEAVGYAQVAATIGVITGPFIGGVVTTTFGIRPTFLGMTGLFAVLLVLIALEPDARVEDHRRTGMIAALRASLGESLITASVGMILVVALVGGALQLLVPLHLSSLGVDSEAAIVVTRDQVNYAKPDPDLFIEAARRLGTATQGSYVIGDSIWDMIASARCGALGIGLLSGGYGREELERAGALRVYDDPADMLLHLDELAPRTRD